MYPVGLSASGLKWSMGAYGTSTGAPDLESIIQGKPDSLRVKADRPPRR
jgi:hypothetical protein